MDTPEEALSLPSELGTAEETEEQIEDRAELLRGQAQEKLDRVKERLLQAKQDLETVSPEQPAPKRNPFARARANLKQKASELQSAPIPVLPKSEHPHCQIGAREPETESGLDGSE